MSHEYLRAIAGSGLGDGVVTFGRVGLLGNLLLVRLHGADGPIQIVHDHRGTPRTEGDVLLVAPTQEGPGLTGYRVVEHTVPILGACYVFNYGFPTASSTMGGDESNGTSHATPQIVNLVHIATPGDELYAHPDGGTYNVGSALWARPGASLTGKWADDPFFVRGPLSIVAELSITNAANPGGSAYTTIKTLTTTAGDTTQYIDDAAPETDLGGTWYRTDGGSGSDPFNAAGSLRFDYRITITGEYKRYAVGATTALYIHNNATTAPPDFVRTYSGPPPSNLITIERAISYYDCASWPLGTIPGLPPGWTGVS